jgi:putative ABC transport system permease protein
MFDFQLDLVQEEGANISQIKAQIPIIEHYSKITALEFRLVRTVSLNVSTPSRFQVTQGKLFGINVTNRPSVNDYAIEKGVSLSSDDAGQPKCLLQIGYADYHKIDPNNPIRVIIPNKGEQTLNVVGIAHFAEFFSVRGEGTIPVYSVSQFGAIYLPLETIQNLFNLPAKVNQLIVRVSSPQYINTVQSELVEKLSQLGYDSTVTLKGDVPSYWKLYDDLKNDRVMMRSIDILFLLSAGLGTFITVSRLITSQRRLIGISLALGRSKKAVIGQYILFATIIGFFASILGVVLGTLIDFGLYGVMHDFFTFPVWKRNIEWDIILFGIVLGPVLGAFFAFFPAYSASRMTPVDAIRLDPLAGTSLKYRPSWGQKLANFVPVSISLKMPIRNVFRNRRRTISTLVGLSVALIISFSILALMDSLNTTVDRTQKDIGTWDLRGRSAGFQNTTIWNETLTQTSQGINLGYWEFGLDLGVRISHGNKEQELFLSGIQSESLLRPLKFEQGSLDSEGIAISRRTAEELDISVGELVSMEHLARDASNNYYLKTSSIRIAAIHSSVVALEVFIMLEKLQELTELQDAANVLYFSIGAVSETSARKLLYNEVPGIVYVESYDDLLKDTKEAFTQIQEIFNFAQLFSVILAFALVFNTVTVNVAERNREIGTGMVLGTPKWVIVRLLFVENLLLGILALIPGILLGAATFEYVFINWIFKDIAPELIFSTAVSASTWLFVIGLIFGTICLAQIPGIRRAINLDLAQSTKVLE